MNMRNLMRAGLSASLYTGWFGMKTVLIENVVMGGQIINTHLIENYPGIPDGIMGTDLVMAVEGQATKFGQDLAFGHVASLDVRQRPMLRSTGEA